MTIEREYALYAVEKACEILAVDSPTGFTKKAAEWVKNEFSALGCKAEMLNKGGVLIDFGGRDAQDALLIGAHVDTLGTMVAEIKSNGRLRVTNLGGLHAESTEGENVRVYTRDGRIYDGTHQLCNPSIHVNRSFSDTKRTFDSMEIVLDEDVNSADDVRALGIDVGDIVAYDPRTRITQSGYIKSRFLDDKLELGMLLAFAKFLGDNGIELPRRVYAHITVYEEVGHGGAGPVPAGVTEGLSMDMGCIGDGVQCTEKQVSICAKDSYGPYSYEMVTKLVNAAKREGADYAIDVYPNYSSDIETAVIAGNDIRHALIGAGVYASHGYERSHIDGVWNTLKLLKGYLEI